MEGRLLSVGGVVSSTLWTNSVSWLERPGHHTADFALCRQRTIPWCPSCNLFRVSGWRVLGITILCPHMSNPSPIVSSPWSSQ